MITVILLNSLLLSLIDYKDRDSVTKYNQTIDQINTVFTVIFIFEAILKIFS
jgi:Ion transport protein